MSYDVSFYDYQVGKKYLDVFEWGFVSQIIGRKLTQEKLAK